MMRHLGNEWWDGHFNQNTFSDISFANVVWDFSMQSKRAFLNLKVVVIVGILFYCTV